MQVDIQMVITQGEQKTTHTVLCLECKDLSIETLGLTLKDSKAMTAEIQKTMIEAQVKDYISRHRECAQCGQLKLIKSYHTITCRILFGKIHLRCPRLLECPCKGKQPLSISPLSKALVSRSTPDLIYMESRWASLMSYGVTAAMLEDVFPIKVSSSSIYNTAMKVATRLEQELPEERHMYIEGGQRTWNDLPRPGLPLTVGIDGGYVHAREGKNRKAGWFEVIVGKSLQEEHASKRFGYVSTYDTKSKRRLHEMLKDQGLQMNQEITFLTDGGDTVRDLPFYLSPRSEHILDWFHITMKITVIKQIAKRILGCKYQKFQDEIDSIKWYLWHGNTFRALDLLEPLSDELYTFQKTKKTRKITPKINSGNSSMSLAPISKIIRNLL